ncbi:ribonuclease T [Sphingomonas sp. Leaf17]|uniref:ribonuclease T2 family protein n=1 Tax=Sphingomonas sp. Leaf17 TaxID=1735683 RepID=UPI0006F8DB07|nr:ribonuclease T [Sphingomonas sp. Leaf17]KQM64915.1 ribonuclease T [Sphingomonas sp. Leaf17]
MTNAVRTLIAITLFASPAVAQAQAYSCSVPATPPRPRPDLPTASQPRRVLPIGSYTLAISWTPQYCRQNGRQASARFQCGGGGTGGGGRFGFTLHGLWPDGVGKDWPQYCKSTDLLSAATIRRNLCSTPSAQLLQHEWAKHGTCMPGFDPDAYFARSTALYGRLRYPDMNALSRRPLTAGGLAQAMARSNPGLGAGMMRVTANRQGWLDEIWICLDTAFRYTRCPAHQGGLKPGATLKIWRGGR